MEYASQIIYGLVASSLVLQMILYLTASLRKRSESKCTLGLISIIFSLSKSIPAFTLLLISSFAIILQGGDTDLEAPLLVLASFMLFHLMASQERETPLSLQWSEISQELYHTLLEFLFYALIFLIAFIYLSISWYNESVSLAFVLLAFMRTFGKIKHLQNRRNEIKQRLSSTELPSRPRPLERGFITLNEEGVTQCARYLFEISERFILNHGLLYGYYDSNYISYFLQLSPENACWIVVAELELFYHKYYERADTSTLELFIICIILCPINISDRLNAQFYTITAVIWLHVSITFVKEKKTLAAPLMIVAPICCLTPYFLPFLTLILFLIILCLYVFPEMLTIFPLDQPDGWSRTIKRFNLLEYSLRKPSKLSASIDYMLNTWSMTGKEQYQYEIGEVIFRKLRGMILIVSNDSFVSTPQAARQIIAAKGLWVIKQNKFQDLVDSEASFEERVLLLHVATTILYHTQRSAITNTQDDDHNPSNSFKGKLFKGKLLSDYMGYLLIVQPWIMSESRGVMLRRCLEMWATIYELTKNIELRSNTTQEMRLQRVCKEIHKHQSTGQDQTKNVLQRACVLAQKLESAFLDPNQMWNVIFKVWVEQLAYAAVRCTPINHIRGLSQGGELVSLIWLWMIHFGLS